ncbi:DUF2007 domain-containing protein [Flavobacterium sp.]|uniref:DUF2007 domain-containing protein n=1 Tax=Flavobacterium sp. TaxID=239 RepID=UPI0037B8DA94
MIVVFNGSNFEAMNVRNLLENEGISVFVQNEYMSNIEPWVVTSGGLNPVKLQVDESDFEQAESIIKNYLDGNTILESEI